MMDVDWVPSLIQPMHQLDNVCHANREKQMIERMFRSLNYLLITRGITKLCWWHKRWLSSHKCEVLRLDLPKHHGDFLQSDRRRKILFRQCKEIEMFSITSSKKSIAITSVHFTRNDHRHFNSWQWIAPRQDTMKKRKKGKEGQENKTCVAILINSLRSEQRRSFHLERFVR